jgi:putative ABC transport system permease protein
MFRNYLITALRNFTRHKLYSFINIAGLTVGLTCAIFIILFVRDQLSYDRWIPGAERLYRLEQRVLLPGEPDVRLAMSSFPMAQAMLDHIPEINARTRVNRRPVTATIGGRQFSETADIVDPNFLDVIRLPLAMGEPSSVLARPDSILLSQSFARTFFGRESPVGKTILISSDFCDEVGRCQIHQNPLTVTGVLRDLPGNTQLIADILIPNTSLANSMSEEVKTSWTIGGTYSYIRLAPGANSDVVTAKFNAVIDRLVDPMKLGNLHMRGSQLIQPILIPFRDVHLTSDRYKGMKAGGSWAIVYGFSAIGILILLVACFNFTNLSTARAMVRAREISLRKVVGATRRQLAIQFLGESVLTAMVALVLALAVTEILTPSFDRFVGLPIALHYGNDWPLLFFILGIGCLVGLLSGIYPALVLSGFRPAVALRTRGTNPQRSDLVRTALVVLQFAVSIGLGIAALVMFAQLSFAHGLDLGLRKDGVVVIDWNVPATAAEAQSFTDALQANPGVSDVAFSDDIPFSSDNRNFDVHVPGNATAEMFRNVPASPDYIRLYGIRLLAGRLLSEKHGEDFLSLPKLRGQDSAPTNVLISDSGARRLGYSPDQALGKSFYMHKALVTIVGVVADAKMDGPKNPIAGIIYYYWPTVSPSYMSIRLSGYHLADTLSFIDQAWHRFAPNTAIKRHFLNDSFEQQFQADEREGTIFDLFVGIAIFIACLGLFGLAAFSTERRTKEIGLRKTFGARTSDIVWMLLWQFSIPVLVANLIAWPVAYYYLHGWLEGYAYRIALSPLYFIGAGAVALVIAWATVIVHAAHVARANPIQALRYE